ncbi:MAG: hypothetical protein DDT25_00331 [Chloroflexi bacterium]|nr:hypothetical protein [Chloroflexota bacterium]
MRDRKKIAAIMAAIDAYLLAVGSRQSAVPGAGDYRLRTIDHRPSLEVSFWRVSGRQEIMQMRALWQRRLVGSR